MKFLYYLFIILIICLGVFINNQGTDRLKFPKDSAADKRNGCLGLCFLFELSSGPELELIEHNSTGAIVEELIKAIEQEIPIIASSILLAYLKLLIEKKLSIYEMVKSRLRCYSLFQTEQDNFVLLIPQGTSASFGFNNKLKAVDLDTLKSNKTDSIHLEELKSIFLNNNNCNNLPEKSIYLSGHGMPAILAQVPVIAALTLGQYKEFVSFLSDINCKFLFISSCYAAGLNMVNAHADFWHRFPIAIGNLTDSSSNFYPNINFKKYFSILNNAFKNTNDELGFLYSEHFKKAIKKICGNSLNNTPWIKLPNSEKFFLLNSTNNLIINDNEQEIAKSTNSTETKSSQKAFQQPTIVVGNSENLLVGSANIQRTLKIIGIQLPEIISVIPGQSYHIFRCIKAKNQTLYDLVNCILKVPYEFTKVFFFKKAKVRKAKRRLHKFKVITIKNLLIINHGIHQAHSTNDVFRDHELYFQKGTHYHQIHIPAGTKIGYLEVELNILPLHNKKIIIHNFLQISKPSDHILKSIGEFL